MNRQDKKVLVMPDVRGNSEHSRSLFVKHFNRRSWSRIIFLGNFFAIPSFWEEKRKQLEARNSARYMAEVLGLKKTGAPIEVLWSASDLALKMPLSPGFITMQYNASFASALHSFIPPSHINCITYAAAEVAIDSEQDSQGVAVKGWLFTSAGLNLAHFRKVYSDHKDLCMSSHRIKKFSIKALASLINLKAAEETQMGLDLIRRIQGEKKDGSNIAQINQMLRQAATQMPELLPVDTRGVLWNAYRTHESIPNVNQVFGTTPGSMFRAKSHSGARDFCCDVYAAYAFELDVNSGEITELT